MTPRPGILTLTTDFGTADGYVGAMKGELLRRAPGTTLVDLSHDIPPQDVMQGAWCLRRSIPRFPKGTIHLAVIDPGVGTDRRALAVETEHFLLLGPDNGVLMWAAERDGIRHVRSIATDRGPWRRSTTFDGLALFAAAAGELLAGMEPSELGGMVTDWNRLRWAHPRVCQNAVEGEVISHDRFGNAITNLTPDILGERPPARLEWGEGNRVRLCAAYSDMSRSRSEAGAVWNSDGHLELFTFAASARERFGLARGTPVRVFFAN